MMTAEIPGKQVAVQLVGPDQLRLNESKPVPRPGPFQVLARVEAVGLCFSDLKLLKQFHQHVRKSEVISGIPADVLREIPSYVPGDKPTVPGHEVVCTILEVGGKVTDYKPGERYLIQPDFRPWKTAGSNSALGYNFEGALQQYLLLDIRVLQEPTGDRYLLPVRSNLGSSQVALSEPWACVEDSYVTCERQAILAGGRLLVVAEAGHAIKGLEQSFQKEGKPAAVTAIVADESQKAALVSLGLPLVYTTDIAALPDEGFDDIVYFGAKKETLDALNSKLAKNSIMNVVLGGRKIGQPVSVGLGRVHYGPTRWVGTTSGDAADGYAVIPVTGEVRDGDSIIVIGAGGPMGQMHVLRNICSGKKGISIVATDFEDARLAALDRKARPMAEPLGVPIRMANPKNDKTAAPYSYFALMAPVAELVAQAIRDAKHGAIINVFAGIPAPVCHEIDLDRVIELRIFMFGTSGSTMEDMRIVLGKVESGQLNTDASVDAVSGMAGAIKGIKAVEERTMAGKIIVYPMLKDVDLIPLSELGNQYPTVAAKLQNGQWCKEAEDEFLRAAGGV